MEENTILGASNYSERFTITSASSHQYDGLPGVRILIILGTIQKYGINTCSDLETIIVNSGTLYHNSIYYAPRLTRVIINGGSFSGIEAINSGKYSIRCIVLNVSWNLGSNLSGNLTTTKGGASGNILLHNRTTGVITGKAVNSSWYASNKQYVNSHWWVVDGTTSNGCIRGSVESLTNNTLSIFFASDNYVYQQPSGIDKKAYYNAYTGQKVVYIPNVVFRAFENSLNFRILNNHVQVSFINGNVNTSGIWYYLTQKKFIDSNFSDSGSEYSANNCLVPYKVLNGDLLGKINDSIAGTRVDLNSYNYFLLKVSILIDEYHEDNKILVPFINVLKKHYEFSQLVEIHKEGEQTYVDYIVVFPYSENSVNSLQNIIREYDNAAKKFKNNIYSINTHININEKFSEDSEYIGTKLTKVNKYYRYYTADRLIEFEKKYRNVVFDRLFLRKWRYIPKNFNFYHVDTDKWTYFIYRWPEIVDDKGNSTIDFSILYDFRLIDAYPDMPLVDGLDKEHPTLLVMSSGKCSFKDEQRIETPSLTYDEYGYEYWQTEQEVFILDDITNTYFETPYKRIYNYRYSYDYKFSRIYNAWTFVPKLDIMYDDDNQYEVRYLYKYEDDDYLNPGNPVGFVYTKNPPTQIILEKPTYDKSIHEQQGRLWTTLSDGSRVLTEIHFSIKKQYRATKYGVVNGVEGYYIAYYLYDRVNKRLISDYVLTPTRVDNIPYGYQCEPNVDIYINKKSGDDYDVPVIRHIYMDYYWDVDAKIKHNIKLSEYDTLYSKFDRARYMYVTDNHTTYLDGSVVPPLYVLGKYENGVATSKNLLFPNKTRMYVIDFTLFSISTFEMILLGEENKTRISVQYRLTYAQPKVSFIYKDDKGLSTEFTLSIPKLPVNSQSFVNPYYVYRLVVGTHGMLCFLKNINDTIYNTYTSVEFKNSVTYTQQQLTDVTQVNWDVGIEAVPLIYSNYITYGGLSSDVIQIVNNYIVNSGLYDHTADASTIQIEAPIRDVSIFGAGSGSYYNSGVSGTQLTPTVATDYSLLVESGITSSQLTDILSNYVYAGTGTATTNTSRLLNLVGTTSGTSGLSGYTIGTNGSAADTAFNNNTSVVGTIGDNLAYGDVNTGAVYTTDKNLPADMDIDSSTVAGYMNTTINLGIRRIQVFDGSGEAYQKQTSYRNYQYDDVEFTQKTGLTKIEDWQPYRAKFSTMYSSGRTILYDVINKKYSYAFTFKSN